MSEHGLRAYASWKEFGQEIARSVHREQMSMAKTSLLDDAYRMTQNTADISQWLDAIPMLIEYARADDRENFTFLASNYGVSLANQTYLWDLTRQ